jgi:hypothetical protein
MLQQYIALYAPLIKTPRYTFYCFVCSSTGGSIFAYTHCPNCTVGSSTNFVTISAIQKLNGRRMICGAKKLSSRPSGPAFESGNLLIQCGVYISCASLYQPVATYNLSPSVQIMGPWTRYNAKEMWPRYWLKRHSKKALSHDIRGMEETRKIAAQKRKNHL